MNEFKKLTWRTEATDPELDRSFLSEEAISDLYVYKNFENPIKAKVKKTVKLHLPNEKYVPGLKVYRPIMRRSLLTKNQKNHCLQALKLVQSGKKQNLLTQQEKYAFKVYGECQSKILEENRIFNEFVRDMWLKNAKRMLTKPGVYRHAWSKWKRKMEAYLGYPQFYKELSLIGLNFDENEACVDFQHVVQPLETGTLARYTHTNLKGECFLRINTLRRVAEQPLYNSKLPVSQDANITKLLENHNFDVAISSSALKQIVDYTNTKSKWTIPVVVKEIKIDSKVKKVVFIDKVLPKSTPSIHDLGTHTYKRLLKLNFCQYEAFSYPFKETPIEVESVPVAEKNEETSEDIEEKLPKKEEQNRFIHHNVNYRIWNIKKTAVQNSLLKHQAKDNEINLLVRCKLDGCEDTEQGVLYPVIVRPKIEQNIQYGANIPSKSELARDWTSLFFRLYSVLYRARIHGPTNEVVAFEKCLIQKINTEAHTHYDYKPILGLGVLQKVLVELVTLEGGNYLLQHLPKHEAFVCLMKECDRSVSDKFDLHAECADSKIDRECQENWLPVDVNFILPAHEEKCTIPGLFHGFDGQKVVGKVFKKKKGKKKKKKTQQ